MKFSNINKGKKTIPIGDGVVIIIAITLLLAIFHHENEASIYIIDNAAEIVSMLANILDK